MVAENVTFTLDNYAGLNHEQGSPTVKQSFIMLFYSLLDHILTYKYCKISQLFQYHTHLDFLNEAMASIKICSTTSDFYGTGSIYFNVTDNGYTGYISNPLTDQITVTIFIHY